jgi:glutamyl-tRNA reductase
VDLFVLGTGQSVASASIRERMHMQADELHAALDGLLAGEGRPRRPGLLDEVVPLSTCARLEIYGRARDPERAVRLLTRLVARRAGMTPAEVRKHSYVMRGQAAVRHLLRVAAGLDSVVHGEAQILGQVRAAAHDPAATRGKGPVLHRLFETALSTGKKVRTDTEIGRGAASLASAALAILQREIGSLESVSALVLGAGETGELMARLIRKAGVGRLVIANRTPERARAVAARLGAESAPLSEVSRLLGEADLVVGAVGAEEFVIGPGALNGGNGGAGDHGNGAGAGNGDHRGNGTKAPRARYFLDLAHPRTFDPALADLPEVRLFDLEHVFQRVERARAARAAQAPLAEAIVEEQADGFVRWLRSRECVSVLRAVREQVLELAGAEAERFGQGRSEREREEMRRFARSLARTLLHPPTVALRTADPDSDEGRALLESATALFGVGAGARESSEPS